jgi:predicted GIY-YIG superfamily endonuclease
MWYVYIIRSINSPEQEYIGATADLKRRLPDHNASQRTSQIQAMAVGLVLRIPGQVQGAGIREIPQIPLG